MKRNVRFFSLFMTLTLAIGALAGCGGSPSEGSGTGAGAGTNDGNSVGTESNTPAPAEDAGGESGDAVNITFWTHYTDDIAFTKQKVADFNEEYAGKIQVELNHVSDDYNNVLLLALQNGTGPDIYADGIALDQLVEMKYAAPLDDLMSDEMESRVASMLQVGNNWMNGNWYSLPFRGYNFRLAWNKDLFEAAGLDPESPPKSYDEVIEYAKKITEYGKTQDPQKYGFMLPTGEDWIWWIYGSQMARANGDNYYDFNTGTFDWSVYRPVMELYDQLEKDGSLFPGGTTMQNDPARAQFSAGNVGMIVAASWDIGVFNDQFPAECEWDVAPLPSYDGEFHGYTQLDAGSYLLINGSSDAEHQQAAMTFYEYLLSEETLIEYYEGGYGIPVYDGIAEKVENMPDRPGFAGFADISVDRLYPYEAPVQVEGDGYGTVMNAVLNGSTTLDAAFEDLNTRYNAAVEKGVADGDFVLEDYMLEGFSCMNPAGE